MTHHCPQCSAALDLDALQPAAEGGLQCPHCGGLLPEADSPAWRAVAPLRAMPPDTPDADDRDPSAGHHPPATPPSHPSAHRKILIAGAAALLLLGGLVWIIAARDAIHRSTSGRTVVNKRELNEYFNALVNDGKTTATDLDAIAAIESYGGTFIGLTRDALPWREAEALAKRAGGGILDLSQLGTARQEIINWLGRAHPDTLGKTTWILDGAEPLGIDSPDFGPVTTLDRPRRAFVFWPGNMPTGWEWAVEPRFDEALPFENGVARVRVGDKWGLIDTTGKELHAPAFDFIGPFSEHGCAPIYQGDQVLVRIIRKSRQRSWPVGLPGPEVPPGVTCGLIDRSGQVLARAEWQDVQNHIHGFTPVKRDGKWGYLDAGGKPAIACEWDDAWRFSAEGFAVVTRNKKRGIIDKAGKIIIQPEWDGVINFCKEGIGVVRKGEGWALVDNTGRLLSQPKWKVWLADKRLGWDDRRMDLGFIPVADDSGFSLLGTDGRLLAGSGFTDFQRIKAGAILTRADGTSTLFGAGGREMLKFRGMVSPPSEDLHRVIDGNQFGFIGEDGTFRIAMRQGTARDFSDGLAAFSIGSKWGFIDKQGNSAIEEHWDEVRDFCEGRAAVRQGNLWGFIDCAGTVVAFPRWTAVGDFSCGRAAVTESNVNSRSKLWAFVDPSGLVVFSLEQNDWWRSGAFSPRFVNHKLGVYRRYNGWIQLDPTGEAIVDRDNGGGGPDALWRADQVDRSPDYMNRTGIKGKSHALKNQVGAELMSDVDPQWVHDTLPFPYAPPPKFGLADSSGNTLAPTVWDEVEIVSPEWVKFRVGKSFGLADATGKVVLQPEWDEVKVLTVDSASINRDGRTVLSPMGRKIHAPWIRVRKGNKTTLYQKSGQAAMPPEIAEHYFDFYGSTHLVLRQPAPGGAVTWSLYEPASGRTTTFPDAVTLRWNWDIARSGLLWFQHKSNGRWHLTTTQGEDLGHSRKKMPLSWTITPDGIGYLDDDDAKWFLVDSRGKRIGTENWEKIRPFVEGFAAVFRDGKWGFVGRDGITLCPPRWDEVGDFKYGMANVRSGRFWGFIGRDGTTLVEPVWDQVMPFEECWMPRRDASPNGRWIYSKVAIAGRWAAIAPSGQLLVDPKHLAHWGIEEPEVAGNIESAKLPPQSLPPAFLASIPESGASQPSAETPPRVIVDKPSWGYARLKSVSAETVD